MKQYLTEKYIRRMQNGGGAGNVGVSVAAPNPQPYIAPLQGLNPNVFKYEVNTKPLDTSPLIQVMQTKDSLAVAREKIAVDLQEAQLKKEMQEKQLEFQEIKFMNELAADMFKASGGMHFGKDGNPVVSKESYMDTVRWKTINAPIQAKIEAEREKFTDIASMPSNPAKMGQIMKIQNNIRKLAESMIPDPAFRADIAFRDSILKMKSDPSSKYDVSDIQARRFLDTNDAWWKMEPGGDGYKPGVQDIVVYDKKEAAKAFDKITTDAQAATKISDVATEPTGGGGATIVQRTANISSAPEVAAQEAAQRILSDRKVLAYTENRLGIDLTTDPEIGAKLLTEALTKEFKASEDRRLRELTPSEEYKSKIDPVNKTSIIKYEGEINRTESRNTVANILGEHTYTTNGGQKVIDVAGMSADQLDEAASALTNAVAPGPVGKGISAQEVRNGRDQLSLAFIRAGGDPDSQEHIEILRTALNSVNTKDRVSPKLIQKLERDIKKKSKVNVNNPNDLTNVPLSQWGSTTAGTRMPPPPKDANTTPKVVKKSTTTTEEPKKETYLEKARRLQNQGK